MINAPETPPSFDEIRLKVPSTMAIPILVIALSAIALCLFLWQVPFTKREEIVGALRVVERPVHVSPQTEGILSSLPIQDGQTVKKGDILAVVYRDVTIIGGKNLAKSQIEELAKQREQIIAARDKLSDKAGLLEDRSADGRSQVEAEIQAGEKVLAEYLAREKVIKEKYKRMKKLYQERNLTVFEMDEIKNQYNANKHQILQAKRSIENARARTNSFDIEKKDGLQAIQDARAELEGRIKELDLALKETRTQISVELRAPVDGVIEGLKAKQGDAAIPGENLLSIVPVTNDLRAELYISARTLPFIKDRIPIWLAFDAFPPAQYGLFKGSLDLSTSTLMTMEEQNTLPAAETSYIVHVTLPKKTVAGLRKSFPLRDGITLSAKVPLEERKLWDWITEPIERMLSDSEETAEPKAPDAAVIPAETEAKPLTKAAPTSPKKGLVPAPTVAPAH